MIDLQLKFDTKEVMESVLESVGFEELAHTEAAVDVIGIIHKPTGVVKLDSEGFEYPELEPVEGWHVNIRTWSQELADSLIEYQVYPVTPVRVWA